MEGSGSSQLHFPVVEPPLRQIRWSRKWFVLVCPWSRRADRTVVVGRRHGIGWAARVRRSRSWAPRRHHGPGSPGGESGIRAQLESGVTCECFV